MKFTCCRCGKPVTNDLPEHSKLYGFVLCPDCFDAPLSSVLDPSKLDAHNLLRESNVVEDPRNLLRKSKGVD
ncbi:MAG: hypothetical protein PVI03_02015 [Candidatus Thorarchaeota archaeon]|jgi:hypothetical protein